MPNAAVMLCAGSGSRMRGAVGDKVLAPLASRPVLEHALRAFLAAGVVEQFAFVTRDAAQQAAIGELFAQVAGPHAQALFAAGGPARQDSVFNGLQALPLTIDHVFIHDCARPLVTPDNLRALLAAVQRDRAAVLAHRVTDTIKQAPARKRPGLRRLRLRDLRRETLWAMETPQVFERELVLEAYRQWRLRNETATDDVAAVTALGHRVTIVENLTPNPKLTHPEDFAWAESLLRR